MAREKPRVKAEEEAEEEIRELVIQHATLETEEEVISEVINEVIIEPCKAVISGTQKVLKNATPESVTVIQQAPPEPEPEPLPEPVKQKKREQTCKKHSRCHCDLLSLETTDFFAIKV